MQFTPCLAAAFAVAGILLPLGACGSDAAVAPSNVRFGQVGEIRVTVVSPVPFGILFEAGELEEMLVALESPPVARFLAVSERLGPLGTAYGEECSQEP